MITQNGFRIYELAKRQNFNDKCNGVKKAVKKCTNGKDKRNETGKKEGLEYGKGSGMINVTSERRVRIYLYASFLYSAFFSTFKNKAIRRAGKLNCSTTANRQIKPMPKEGGHF